MTKLFVQLYGTIGRITGKIMLCNSPEEKDLAEIKGVACRLFRHEDHPPFTEPPEEV